MGKSRWKSSTNFGTFTNPVCYFSNKRSKRLANRHFRAKSRMKLITDLINDNLENHINYNKVREVSDVWDFDSDGLKCYISFKNPQWFLGWNGPYTRERINKYKRK